MKKHHIITTALLILVFVCLLVSPAASQDTSKKTWSLKYWVPLAKSMWQAEIETRFADSVKKATNGRVNYLRVILRRTFSVLFHVVNLGPDEIGPLLSFSIENVS
jgi:hypothetical protein